MQYVLLPFILLACSLTLHAQPVSIVFIGNSITYGACLTEPSTEAPPVHTAALLREKGYEVAFANCGYSGSTTVDFLPGDKLLPRVVQAADSLSRLGGPLVFSMMLGTNDSAMRGTKGAPVSPDRYRHNLLCIIDSLHARYPGSYFILHRPLWYSPNTHNGATYLAEGLQRLQTYTPVLDELPRERPYILPGDRKAYDRFRRQHRKLLTPEAGNSGTFYLHPNKAGAEVLAGYWTKSIIHNMKNYVLQDK